jgi:gamma-glutamylcyclotransferase (GGCT)/AIG2-like uncharacterized protein YtfP
VTDRLFVYGTLQPGASAWPLLEPWVAGSPRPATLPGSLYDTGRGYPALRLGGAATVSGWLVTLRTPAALSAMDSYEGPEYQRIRVPFPDGLAWTYVWARPFDGLRLLSTPWPSQPLPNGAPLPDDQ